MSGVKFLLTGFEACGKSTITSALTEAIVVNMDQKEYNFKVPHVNIKEYEGMDVLITLVTQKVEAYSAKFGKLPKTIVFDTVTQMYSAMQKHNADKYKGLTITRPYAA